MVMRFLNVQPDVCWGALLLELANTRPPPLVHKATSMSMRYVYGLDVPYYQGRMLVETWDSIHEFSTRPLSLIAELRSLEGCKYGVSSNRVLSWL